LSTNDIKIAPAKEADLSGAEALFRDRFGDEAAVPPFSEADTFFVAKYDEQIVGAGALFTSFLHREIPRVAIAVREKFQRRGIGRDLHRALTKRTEGTPGFDGACFDDDADAIGFLSRLGYRPSLDCFIPVVDTAAGVSDGALPTGIEIASFASAANPIERKSSLDFLVASYIRTHHWSPVAIGPNDPLWEKIAFRGLRDDFSLVARRDGKIVGASTAHVEEKALQIRWVFAPFPDASQELEILKGLVGAQLARAHESGLETATFECDSTDPVLFQIPRHLKVLSAKTWRRFRYAP